MCHTNGALTPTPCSIVRAQGPQGPAAVQPFGMRSGAPSHNPARSLQQFERCGAKARRKKRAARRGGAAGRGSAIGLGGWARALPLRLGVDLQLRALDRCLRPPRQRGVVTQQAQPLYGEDCSQLKGQPRLRLLLPLPLPPPLPPPSPSSSSSSSSLPPATASSFFFFVRHLLLHYLFLRYLPLVPPPLPPPPPHSHSSSSSCYRSLSHTCSPQVCPPRDTDTCQTHRLQRRGAPGHSEVVRIQQPLLNNATPVSTPVENSQLVDTPSSWQCKPRPKGGSPVHDDTACTATCGSNA